MQPIASLTLVLLLSFIAEGLTEYFARPFFTPRVPNNNTPPNRIQPLNDARPPVIPPPPTVLSPMWLRYVAALVGIVLSLAYRVDLLAMFGYHAFHPIAGMVLTGILVGRGSNYMHDLVDRYFQPIPKPLDRL